MELIDVITSKENLNRAYKKVVANKGAGGVDGMKVEELGTCIKENKEYHGRGAGGAVPCNENGGQAEHAYELQVCTEPSQRRNL